MPRNPDLDHVKSRIRAVRLSSRLPKFDYIERLSDGTHSKMFCKACGEIIKELIPHDGFREVRVINDQKVVFERLIMAETNHYEEIEMDFLNSTNLHVSPVCRNCSNGLTRQQLDDMYVADLNTWKDEEDLGMGEVRWDVLARRRPKRRRRRLRQRGGR